MDQVDLSESCGSDVAVSVRGAYKRFSPQAVVLQGLNMTVREGSIYALLGPSGCGKTTLLRCLIGRDGLDAGEILLKAKRRRNVGYMPQELAIFINMTIAETLRFYGRIAMMNSADIKSRTLDLIKFLALPTDENRLVGDLSGGQQRRVSLAVALVHDPQLFILDEPTVGIDPLLSQSIWEKLLEMSEMYKKTIIITTHYIEEARKAHTIGLMRNGILLAEESPLELMYNQNCSSLEEAFLKLSYNQENTLEADENTEEPLTYPTPTVIPRRTMDSESMWCKDRFFAQVIKNFIFNMRNFATMLFILLLPALETYLVCNTIIEPEHLKLAVISNELTNGFSDCNVPSNLTCSKDGRPLSCKYMDRLRLNKIDLEEYRYVDDGVDAVKRGKAWGLIHFAENYTDAIYNRIEHAQNAEVNDIEWSNIYVQLDMSNLWISSFVQQDIYFSFVDYFKEIFVECGSLAKASEFPVRFEDPIFGMRNQTYFIFIYSGLLVTFGFFLPIMFTTGAVLTEKHVGLLERSLSAGSSVLEIAAAHSVIQFMFVTIQNVILFTVLYIVYETPRTGNIYLILVLMYLVETAGMLYAFFLAILFESEKWATYFGTGTIVMVFIFGGVAWPYEGMHWVLKSVIWMFPIQPAVEAFRGISERAWGIDHWTVCYGFISTIIWIILLALGSFLIARKKRIGL